MVSLTKNFRKILTVVWYFINNFLNFIIISSNWDADYKDQFWAIFVATARLQMVMPRIKRYHSLFSIFIIHGTHKRLTLVVTNDQISCKVNFICNPPGCLYGAVIAVLAISTIIIIITRPKPAYGRQGLAGSWGQDTDEVSTFLMFSTSHFAPAPLSSELTNLGPLMTMKIHLETLKNNGNQPKTMKTPWKTMETKQKPWKHLEKPWKPTKNHEKPWNHLKNIASPTRGPNRPPLVQKRYRH